MYSRNRIPCMRNSLWGVQGAAGTSFLIQCTTWCCSDPRKHSCLAFHRSPCLLVASPPTKFSDFRPTALVSRESSWCDKTCSRVSAPYTNTSPITMSPLRDTEHRSFSSFSICLPSSTHHAWTSLRLPLKRFAENVKYYWYFVVGISLNWRVSVSSNNRHLHSRVCVSNECRRIDHPWLHASSQFVTSSVTLYSITCSTFYALLSGSLLLVRIISLLRDTQHGRFKVETQCVQRFSPDWPIFSNNPHMYFFGFWGQLGFRWWNRLTRRTSQRATVMSSSWWLSAERWNGTGRTIILHLRWIRCVW